MHDVRALRRDLRSLIRSLGVLQARYPELGLGVSQCHTLLELELGERSVGELSQLLQIDDSSASRNLSTLERHTYVTHRRDPTDPRRKLFRLTTSGRSKTRAVHRRGDRVMRGALEYLAPDEQRAVSIALGALARAVERSQQATVEIRRSRPSDNGAIARVIRGMLTELEVDAQGSAFDEPATDEIHQVYRRAGGGYWVVSMNGRIEGGGGVMPHAAGLCELKNLYFTSRVRRGGHAKRLLHRLLEFARTSGHHEIFLETSSAWSAAEHLYRRFGFEPCAKPSTYEGHGACDRYYSLRLTDRPVTATPGGDAATHCAAAPTQQTTLGIATPTDAGVPAAASPTPVTADEPTDVAVPRS